MPAFRHYGGHSAVAALAGIATLALVIGARSETLTPAAPKTPDMRNLRLLPPLEYDHPFKGAVELVRMKTQAEVRAACPPNAWTHALACNYYYGLTPQNVKLSCSRTPKSSKPRDYR